jgi:hypothetical protein
VDAGSILGLSALRPAFLVDVSSAEPRKGEAGVGAGLMTPEKKGSGLFSRVPRVFTTRFHLDDDLDDEEDDEDDDPDDEDEDSHEDDDDDEDDEDEETWQVSVVTRIPLKGASGLTSGNDLPRLAGICQLNQSWNDSAGPRLDGFLEGARNRLSSLGVSLGGRNGGLRVCRPAQSHVSSSTKDSGSFATRAASSTFSTAARCAVRSLSSCARDSGSNLLPKIHKKDRARATSG